MPEDKVSLSGFLQDPIHEFVLGMKMNSSPRPLVLCITKIENSGLLPKDVRPAKSTYLKSYFAFTEPHIITNTRYFLLYTRKGIIKQRASPQSFTRYY